MSASVAPSPEPGPSAMFPGRRVITPDLEKEDTEKFMKWKAIKARELRKQRLMDAKRKQELAAIAEEARRKQVGRERRVKNLGNVG